MNLALTRSGLEHAMTEALGATSRKISRRFAASPVVASSSGGVAARPVDAGRRSELD